MRLTFLALPAFLALATPSQLSAADDPSWKSTTEKASYALGASFGKTLKQNGAEIDPEGYTKAHKEGRAGGKLLLTDEQIRETVIAFQTEVRAKSLEKVKKEGETFMRENKKKEGVVTTPSGLQYQVMTKGTGKLPA